MPPANHAILFVVDGLRPDGLQQAPTPAIDRLIEEGAVSWQAQTVTPSVSLPCHTSLFRSVWPARHGVTDNQWAPRPPLVPSIIDAVHEAGLGTASFYTWEPLRDLASPNSLDIAFYRRLGKPHGDDDLRLAALAAQYVVAERPAFTFVYLGATDEVGHRSGWMSGPYLEAISQASQAVGLVLDALQGADLLAETVLLLLADHGGHDFDHAGGTEQDLTIPWIISGPGVRRGHRIASPVHITDTAPTLLHLLGLAAPVEWQGQPMQEALDA